MTPTDLIDDPMSALLEGRRSSSGALLSPEVLMESVAGIKGEKKKKIKTDPA